MMQGMQGGCPMCGMMMGGQQTQPQDISAIRSQIQNLQRRLDELDRGQVSPQQVQQQMSQMCPKCQAMMAGMGAAPSREEMEQQIRQQIQRLEERVGELERKQRPAA